MQAGTMSYVYKGKYILILPSLSPVSGYHIFSLVFVVVSHLPTLKNWWTCNKETLKQRHKEKFACVSAAAFEA